MERENFRYIKTNLISVDFQKKYLESISNVSFSVSTLITKKNNLLIKGNLGLLSDEKSNGSLIMESIFSINSDEIIKEFSIENLDQETEKFLLKPLLTELAMLFGYLTSKATLVPVILPIDDFINQNFKDPSAS